MLAVVAVVAIVRTYSADEIMVSRSASPSGCSCIMFKRGLAKSERLSSVVVTIRGRVTTAGLAIISGRRKLAGAVLKRSILDPDVRVSARG